MTVCAAVMTGPGMGAIATIQLRGAAADAVVREVFRRKDDRPFEPAMGRVLLGRLVEDGTVLDEVTLGCEGPDLFALHCHGNPLLVQRILGLLRQQGVQVVPPEELLTRTWLSRPADDAICLEAKLALTTVKTVEGATLLAHQVNAGLSQKIRQWQAQLDSTPLERISTEAEAILKRSEPARLIVSGCTIALAGLPNTGKSTLLNALAGREKAIVSDLRGTTRDWVSAEIHIPPLHATIIDTAGLDCTSHPSDGIEHAAQQESRAILARADVILLVVDASQPAAPLPEAVLPALQGRRVLLVLNKVDLPARLDPGSLPGHLGPALPVSARQGSGLSDLIEAVHRVCGVADFDLFAPVAFTDRQVYLFKTLTRSRSKVEVSSVLSELLARDAINRWAADRPTVAAL